MLIGCTIINIPTVISDIKARINTRLVINLGTKRTMIRYISPTHSPKNKAIYIAVYPLMRYSLFAIMGLDQNVS